MVDCRIIARVEDAGSVMELVNRKRGTGLATRPMDEEKWLFTARLPWAEVVTDFHDQLKNATAGYGSLDTQAADPPLADASLSKVDILLNGEVVAPLAFVCHRDLAHGEAKGVCKKVRAPTVYDTSVIARALTHLLCFVFVWWPQFICF